ncbi:acyl-CoA thioesterase [Citricoccus sp. SGAir0253]|uniref:acyl-CoA thioesterase n=1 Tax=Citricoccus sp. SGAir0253 TaxID=2567881 RepID=UPI0010CD12E0|nr:thioesterase family protein [Citricoccus sp. SGAir0253]QCU79010.1 acyl-CoA thioesterase [Citricoccus sp. SGAir0253]
MTERFLPVPLDLRWSDQDLLGHVNNARVVTLAEEARVRFQVHLDGPASLEGSGAVGGRVVARQVIDYHRPAHYGVPLEVRVGVLRVGTRSFTLRHQGVQGDGPVFTVDAVMVMVGPDGSSRALTDAERAGLEEWRWPGGDAGDGPSGEGAGEGAGATPAATARATSGDRS